jgi:hypothetical protein
MSDGAPGDGQMDNASMFPLASQPGNLDDTALAARRHTYTA